MKDTTLRAILTKLFNDPAVARKDWAYALGVTEETLTQWESGVVPPPDLVGALYELVDRDARLPSELRGDFYDLLDYPAQVVVVDFPRKFPTLRHYLLQPRQDATMKLFATLDARAQEEVLCLLHREIRTKLEPKPTAWQWPLAYSSELDDVPRKMPEEPGCFGAVRKHDIHTGVDLYAPEGTSVRAVEDCTVVAIETFTGPSVGTPWWNTTAAVLAEGSSGVVCYGEIQPFVKLGDVLRRGRVLGRVLTVLRKDKGRPRSMLHLELYTHGVRETPVWKLSEPKPEWLLDPTDFLERAWT